MSYEVIIVKYKCNYCAKELMMIHKKENYQYLKNYPSLEINCPLYWDWTPPSEHSKTEHYCEDPDCQKKLREERVK